MTLVNRVSAFFLGALALILVVYSAALFLTARSYLERQFDEQLRSSLNTLVAAVEVEEDDVKWEPSDHTVTLGVETGLEDIRWVVVDERGLQMDASRNLAPSPANPTALDESQAILQFARTWRDGQTQSADGQWRFLQYRLTAPHPKPASERDPLERELVIVTVARSTSDLRAALTWLGTLLVVAPVVCWGAAAVIGRWFTRKAIAPVREMAAAARKMKPDSSGLRLPVASAGDELTELGTAFNGVLDQLFEAYERQRRFAGDAAHQLRTPATVLQGEVDVTLRRPRTPEEYQRSLEVVRRQTGELRQTIESMLFLARPPGNDQAVLVEGDLVDLARSAAARWEGQPRAADLRLELGDRVVCRVAPALVGQILDNLIGNAFKYSSPGTPVVVAVRQKDGEGIVEIRDAGIGIEAEAQRDIFEPFFRTRQARQTGAGGTGLGLPIARRMAEAMGGGLTCVSRPGEGSTFSLHIPLSSNAP